jgi:predicted aspartyl protease/Tfp pilus assembly protein PilF
VKQLLFAVRCAALVLVGSLSGCSKADRGQPDTKPTHAAGAADELFQAGQFADAGKLYAATVARDPQDYHATLRLGEIALLANRLDEADQWLTKAIALKPDDTAARLALAQAYYRRDEFLKAAPLLRAAGKEVQAKTLESFKSLTPYQIEGEGEETSVKFVATDPLPLVQVRVNGGKEVTFFLDTGAAEVYLDTEFARELGIESFGSVEGTFAGGKKAAVGSGRIASLHLGAWEVKNLPVYTLGLRSLSKMLGAKQIDGCLGTVLFYHFLTTLDYPHGQLILRRRNAENRKRFDLAQGSGSVTVPFWMASDHFMVTFARINDLKPTLLFVDTGTAGAGVKLGDLAIKEAGVKLLEDQAEVGDGGGGKIRSVPFILDKLALGGDEERNVRGLYEGPFPWAETFGFRLYGMVGHEFFRPSRVTFDFDGMRITLRKG